MTAHTFADRERFDAAGKVLGTTEYAADVQFPDMLYAMTVPASIARGSMTALVVDAAMGVPGVVRVLTSADFPVPLPPGGEDGPPPPPPTLETTIFFRGQPVALVVAETLEAAIQGAEAITPTYAPEPFSALIDSDGAVPEQTEDWTAGDAATALAGATTVVAETYVSPTQHHNPMELMSTVAVWANGRLTIHESTQGVNNTKSAVAGALQIDPAIIDVKSAYVGGGFGQKGLGQRQSALVARAAILLRRPVKIVMPRGQIFHVATYRPNSRHRIELGADANGRMIAARYHAEHEQSRNGFFSPAEYHESPMRMYGIENYLGTAANIRIDRQDPGYMRAPHPQASCFAFESAVDELAFKMGVDPVAFRLANDTRTDPKTGNPLSSRFLNECLEEGARRFGWADRKPVPGSMSTAGGTQIGWGVAAGCYPSMMPPAIASLRIGADGRTTFAVSGHEMGQGIRTAIAAVLLDGLDIDAARLDIVIGDTTAAPQHMTAGSWGTAGAIPATAKAVARMQATLAELLDGRQIAGNIHRQLATIRRPSLRVEVSEVGPGQNADALTSLRQGGFAVAGPEYPDFTTMSYIAHFVEVRIEPRTRRIRMPRVVSIADCGRVISPRTAASQIYGGVVWAFSGALREGTEIDARYGGYLNNDLADYVVAVNADIGDIEVGFVDQPDPLANSMGLKGLGEVAMVGASAAIANAIFHATGTRLREMPIRIEHML
jgi:xanthine dehydrogenase YagR molybdenum-binding subunit